MFVFTYNKKKISKSWDRQSCTGLHDVPVFGREENIWPYKTRTSTCYGLEMKGL